MPAGRSTTISQLESRIFSSPLEGRTRGFAAVPPDWRVEPRANVVGGLLAAVVSLPLSMGLGALAFSSFGPEYTTRGVVAGLFASAFLGLVAVLMGSRGVAMYAPRSLVSFIVASVSADLFLQAKWLPHDPDLVTAAIFLLMAMAGAFQLAFGVARLARVVKFIPTPVMAGFQNAASLIIMTSQLPTLLGLARRPALAEWPAAVMQARPLGVVVALATIVTVFQASRITRKVPPLVLGLVLGTLLYYAFVAAGLSPLLGPTLGAIPIRLPDGHELATVMLLAATVPGFMEALPAIVLGAASIALVASLDVLISAKIVENLSRRRGNGTQELISIGAANLLAPLFGGIAGSISLATTTTAFKGGARNSLALLVHATLFLGFIPLLAPLIGYIPRVVIAAVVFYAGTQLFDRWTLQLVRRVARRRAIHWPSISIDLVVIVVVASVALAGEVVAAVLIGVTIAIIVFTLRMSRGVIRREQYGEAIQSRRAREAGDAALLAAHGRRILAIELEGPLFFASAEMLLNRIDAAVAEGVRHLILDVARVTELDSTGARILVQAEERLRGAGGRLAMSAADARPELAALLSDHGVIEALGRANLYPDLDRALEACEDRLLALERGTALVPGEHPFELLDIVRDLDAPEREALAAVLVRREYATGETVFHQGDEGDALYLIARGSASVWLGRPGADRRRLMTFSQGTFFGEMALLDRERRSASITADEPLACYVLERTAFDRLAQAHPRAGLAVLANLGRELSRRMRRANRTLLELA